VLVSYDAEVVDLISGQQTQDQERADWRVAPAIKVDAARVINRLERGAVLGERIQFRSTASKLLSEHAIAAEGVIASHAHRNLQSLMRSLVVLVWIVLITAITRECSGQHELLASFQTNVSIHSVVELLGDLPPVAVRRCKTILPAKVSHRPHWHA